MKNYSFSTFPKTQIKILWTKQTIAETHQLNRWFFRQSLTLQFNSSPSQAHFAEAIQT